MWLHVRVYPSTSPGFSYPEATLWPGFSQRRNVGVAFSGGGARSACLSLGYLRALVHMGLMRQARYVSCVSGGAWCLVPWTFLPQLHEGVDPEPSWLGVPKHPSELTPAYFDNPERCFAYRATNFDDTELAKGPGAWSSTIAKAFLREDGLDDGRLFTLDDKTAGELRTLNPETEPWQRPRIVERADRPFLIAGSDWIVNNGQHDADHHPVDVTPLYVGCRAVDPRAGPDARDVGGGFVEACGFDSAHHYARGANTGVRLGGEIHDVDLADYRFSLTDVVGMSSAAPAVFASTFGLGPFDGQPRYHAWPVVKGKDSTDKRYTAVEARFGDGGLFDHNGVLALLARGVRNIVCFVNTDALPAQCGDMQRLFGKPITHPNAFNPLANGPHVFQLANADYAALMHRLDTVGWSLDEHLLTPCTGFQPKPGETARVLWIYNTLSLEWRNELPAGTWSRIQKTAPTFPRVPTAFAVPRVPTGFLGLNKTEAYALAHHADWRLTSGADGGALLHALAEAFNDGSSPALDVGDLLAGL